MWPHECMVKGGVHAAEDLQGRPRRRASVMTTRECEE